MLHADVVSICDKAATAVIVPVKLRANLDVLVVLTGEGLKSAALYYRGSYVMPAYCAGVDRDPGARSAIVRHVYTPVVPQRRRIYALRQGSRKIYSH
jgi:hypothetical protein